MSGFSDAHEIFQRNGRRVLVQREVEILGNLRGCRMSSIACTRIKLLLGLAPLQIVIY
jgi:hypothetical protein